MSGSIVSSVLNKKIEELEKESQDYFNLLLEHGIYSCPHLGCKNPAIWMSDECADNYCTEHLMGDFKDEEEAISHGWGVECPSCGNYYWKEVRRVYDGAEEIQKLLEDADTDNDFYRNPKEWCWKLSQKLKKLLEGIE